jgi:hypothetical protein
MKQGTYDRYYETIAITEPMIPHQRLRLLMKEVM